MRLRTKTRRCMSLRAQRSDLPSEGLRLLRRGAPRNDMGRVLSGLWALGIIVMSAPLVHAQLAAPHLGYVYPAGGQQGTTFQVKIGGRSLEGVTNVYVSGAGVQATVAGYDKPVPQKEINTLRERLQELQKKGRDPATLKEMAEIRDKISASLKRLANPALAEIVVVDVAIAPEAPLGTRELRVLTPLGLSNPLVFCISQLPEVRENDLRPGESFTETVVKLPITVNGRIVPTETAKILVPARQGQQFQYANADRYRFEARKGQQLVVVGSARELIPYLADAVPGWFQAVVTLYDTRGRELAYNDDYRFHPDPVLHYEIPQDGDYILEIRDAIYRGREDFVYRITLGELPFVTSIFPLGAPAGQPTSVELKGWNLPSTRVMAHAQDAGKCDLRTVVVASENQPSKINHQQSIFNPVLFAVDTLPECLEKEANDSPQTAQTVTMPVIINGHIDKSGDWDVFRFDGRAGDRIVAETYARRLDSPLDSVLKLTDATGRQLAFNDDHEDKASGLNTHHADSFLLATLPADGTYYLHLGDAQRQGGAEYAYRLRLSPPRPDVELRVVPSSINASAGQTIPLTVYALRQDGFAGDITLTLRGNGDIPPFRPLRPGADRKGGMSPFPFTLGGALVPAQQDQVRLTLTVPPLPVREPLSLRIEGRATIAGREVVRPAVPADDMMQAFAYRHLVPAQDLKITISQRAAMRTPVHILSELPVKIPAGRTALVRVALPTSRSFDKIQFELSEPPEGITVRSSTVGQTGVDLVLAADAAKVKPGLRGNLIVNVLGERTNAPGAAKAKAKANRQRIPLGTLPALPFEIVKP